MGGEGAINSRSNVVYGTGENSLLRARGESCCCHGGSLLFCALAILLSFATYAKQMGGLFFHEVAFYGCK